MDENNTTEFSRESFKERILRELEEANKAQSEGTFEHYSKENQKAVLPEVHKREIAEEPDVAEEVADVKPFSHPIPEDDIPSREQQAQAMLNAFPFDEEEEEEEKVSESEPSPAPEPESPNAEEPTEAENSSLRERLEALAMENQGQSYSRRSRKNQAETEREENADAPQEEEPLSEPELDEEPDEPKARGKKSQKKKKRMTAGKIIAVIVVVLLLAIAGTGFYGYNYVQAGLKPLNTKDQTVKAVNIPAGASSKQIGSLLEKQGIIRNGMVFQYYTKFKNFTGFKSGYYNLSPSMTLDTIAKDLEEGGTAKPVEPVLGKITIPEGYTLKQISEAITVNADQKNGKTPYSTADFMKTVQDPAFIAKMQKEFPQLLASLPAKDSGVKYQLEGYLFPATYDYTKKTTTESLIESMLAAMDAQLKPFYAQMSSNNLTVNQTLSLAALVEKEANNDDDRRNVAGTFFNRMNQGMTLDSNSSILYAQDKLGAKTTLKDDATVDTSLDSPYNLYANTGTGPGPIDNPSLSSIKAVMNPAQNDYLYFVADVTTGKVYFADNLDTQNQNVQTYVNDKLKQ